MYLASGVCLLGLAVSGYAYKTIFAPLGPFWSSAVLEETTLDRVACRGIFQRVSGATLAPSTTGEFKLPPAMAASTNDGKIYITRKNGLVMVLFVTWRGKGSNLRGYLYCDRKLTPKDMHLDSLSRTNMVIDAMVPWVPGGSPASPVELSIYKDQGDNIYYVGRDSD